MQPTNRRDFLHITAAGLATATATSFIPRIASAADDFSELDATAQARLVRNKEVKPIELVEAAIARIEKLNPSINAVVTNLFDEAVQRSKSMTPTGPFAGVPYLLKDLYPNKGARLTYGSVFFKNNMATFTTEIIKRMEASGLVVVGKSNTPEFGLLPITEPKLFGPTKNPWNLEYSPGGSSGGAAAAVAAGLVPIAHASDGGGSIRIPAANCGVFGMKISRGRTPEFPLPNGQGLSVQHCVSRTVRDSAALLDVTRGPTTGDRWWAPPARRPYLEEITREPGRLRIAFTTKDFSGNSLHPDCVAAVITSAKLCEELGHDVEEAAPDLDGDKIRDAFLALWVGIAGGVIKGATQALGRKPDEDQFESWTWDLSRIDAQLTPADIRGAWSVLQPAGYTIARFQQTYDILLTPVLGTPPVKTGELSDLPFEEAREKVTRYVPFTPVINATGQPAMSVPLYWNEAGLPIGSHFIGRYGDEATLFRLAAQLEQARPWAKRWAPVSVAASSS